MHIVLIAAPLIQLRFENARSVVHRASLQSGKRQNNRVIRLTAAKRLIFRATGTFISNKVWIGTAKSCGSNRLVSIDHNVMFCSLLNAMKIVVNHALAVMIFATWNDIAYISAFNGVITILVHELIGFLHATFIVCCAG